MKKNVGGLDRILRIAVGLAIMSVAAYYRAWWGVFGLIIFLTGALSRCTIYSLFRFSTYKGKEAKEAKEEKEEKEEKEDREQMIH